MNFLAHLHLVRGDDQLMLGALLGDFVRGRRALWAWPPGIREGIRVHRRIDKFTDHSQQFKALQKQFPKPFRRYSGIIIDLAFDHELAKAWSDYCDVSLADFDLDVRRMLSRYRDQLPEKLLSFMEYADRRGLFETYQDENEMLLSLTGIGKRLKRSNPLDRVHEIWPDIRPHAAQAFDTFYPELQSWVDVLANRKSTTIGS